MKWVIRNIDRYIINNNTVSFSAEGGSLVLDFFRNGIVKVDYSFEGIAVPEELKEASSFICIGESSLEIPEIRLASYDSEYAITYEDLEIRVRKLDAVISIFKKGRLVHGGIMGNSDTVIPSYTVRLITEGTNVEAYWNFPLKEGDEFYGLGDKSGVPNRFGRSFRFFNRDALGYDASYSDPLYKSVPFFIKNNSLDGVCCGILFPQTMIEYLDFGKESRFFFSAKTRKGPFSYFVFMGDQYSDILASYYKVTGTSIFPPLFSFGFMGSSMNYVEPDDAAERVLAYFNRIEKENIPCEGMYISSGYLKHNGKRYTFLFNKNKFPNPKEYFTSLKNRGYNVTMNIKPGILVTHPWYKELEENGYFIKDKDGKTVTEFYWGGNASFIDFDNPKAVNWWKDQLKEKFLDNGCTGIWNDNNELELEDVEIPSSRVKQLYPLKMSKAAYEVFKEVNPSDRPWNYSRSGYAGIQRYARTWSGDNTSTWTTLKYNQYMSIGFGLSGMPFYGHDIGGFTGEVPEEELLVRASETAVFQARFVIHSWREDGNPTEPWTYPNSKPIIKSLIREHYRMLPYIYSCAYQNIVTSKPLERSLHLEFPMDQALESSNVDCLFGDNVLKINVCEKGLSRKTVIFPCTDDWVDPASGKLHKGGTWFEADVTINGKAHWYARSGSVIAQSDSTNIRNVSQIYDKVRFQVYPSTRACRESIFFADDGKSELSLRKFLEIYFKVSENRIDLVRENMGYDGIGDIIFELPDGFAFDANGERELKFKGISSVPDSLYFKGVYEEAASNDN